MFDLLTVLESKTNLLTIPDVAKILGISQSSVHRLIAKRQIPSFLLGGMRRFDPAQLHRWIIKKNKDITEGRESQLDK